MELPSPLFLRTFRKAFELRNFTATAKILGMTQSGVSQHVAHLEALLEAPLFERVGRGLVPTKIGELVYSFGGTWLAQMEELIHDVREGERRLSGRVVLGAPGSFGVYLLKSLVEWQSENPGLIVEMEYGPNSVMARELHSGRMDLAVTSAPLDEQIFVSEEIFQQEYILVSHPELKPKFATLEEFAANPIVDYVGGENIFQAWMAAHFKTERASGVRLNVRAKINNMESIFFLLQRKVGVTIFPSEPLFDLLRAKKLKAHKTGKSVHNALYIVQRQGQKPSYRVQVLRALITAMAHR